VTSFLRKEYKSLSIWVFMNLLLIGCGRTGRAIAENMLDLNFVKTLFLYSRTSKSSKSLSLDLNSKKVKVVEDIKSLKNIDFIIITLSGMSDTAREESFYQSETTYQVRQDELKFNIGAITHLIEDLRNFSQKTSIIVVTNPVDEITNYLRIMLNKENVLGFGLELDAKRYEKALGKKVYCLGTHGKAVPLINSKNEKEYEVLSKKIDNTLLEYIRKYGIPHKMAGINFKEFFEKLNSKKKEVIHISFYLKDSYLGVKNISISLPCEVKLGKIIKIAKIQVNEIEKNRFIESAEELKKSVQYIIETHKKLIEYE
jgi:L-lactate dehydrogenase